MDFSGNLLLLWRSLEKVILIICINTAKGGFFFVWVGKAENSSENNVFRTYLGLWRGENNTMVALEKGLRADSRGERANQWLFWKRF